MAQIIANTTTIKSKAQELNNMNSRLKMQISSLQSQERTLSGMWEGDSKTAFQQAFNKDVTQMNSFCTAIPKYVQALNEIAAKYEAAERANTNIATTRNYR